MGLNAPKERVGSGLGLENRKDADRYDDHCDEDFEKGHPLRVTCCRIAPMG